jgi:hypothetical protein
MKVPTQAVLNLTLLMVLCTFPKKLHTYLWSCLITLMFGILLIKIIQLYA